MHNEEYTRIINDQIDKCLGVLVHKGREYATDDILHNFKVAAKLQGVSVRRALAGFMAKHTVSIYDMCRSERTFSELQWEEKLTDHINYLLLLAAVIEEERALAAPIPHQVNV